MQPVKAIFLTVLTLNAGLLTPVSFGAEIDQDKQDPGATMPRSEIGTTAAPAELPKTSPNAPEPKAQQPLTQPTIGPALESFTPSESISADNAVPFPINI